MATLLFLVLHVLYESKPQCCRVSTDKSSFLSFDIKKDGDTVVIFTETAIQTKQEVRLTQGGMLLMALLGGGDYDTVCTYLDSASSSEAHSFLAF
jgi:hypothetical protein